MVINLVFITDERVPSIEFHVKYFITGRYKAILCKSSFIFSASHFREYRLTIPEAEKSEFKLVCNKLMNRFPEEIAEGSLIQADFKKIQTR